MNGKKSAAEVVRSPNMKALIFTLSVLGSVALASGENGPLKADFRYEAAPKVSLVESNNRVSNFLKKGAKLNYSDKFLSSISLVYVESHPRKGQAWVHVYSNKQAKMGGEISVYDYIDGPIIELSNGF